MKKTVLMIACALATTVVSAQDMNSKKGTPILPASGDWSIGIDASSLLDYAGNLMNGSNSAFVFDWQNPGVITGKMMKDDNTAYRVGVRLGFGSNTEGSGDTTSGALSETKVSGNDINLSAGLQMYRGQGRLKGYYGAEAGLGLSGAKTTYSYNGNASAGSTLEEKAGSTFGLAIRGFIGVEYFFAPKMSISGEYGWGLGLSSTGEGETKTADGSGGSDSSKTGKSSSFGIDTDNAGGAINLHFYF
ncbi:MAG: hypothetical protein ACKOX7_08535 [Bacteroidota bacterium]